MLINENKENFLIQSKLFQYSRENDNLIISVLGADGIVLSSNYNLRAIPPEILVKGSKSRIIKKRQKYKDFI